MTHLTLIFGSLWLALALVLAFAPAPACHAGMGCAHACPGTNGGPE